MKASIWIIIKAIFLVGFGLGLTRVTEFIIPTIAPERVVSPDLFFRILPRLDWMAYVADILVVIGVGITSVVLYKKNKLPYYFALLGLMYIFRAIINILTPLGDPSGDEFVYGFLEFAPAYGMYPSGHTGALALSFFLLKDEKAKTSMGILAIVTVLEAFALLFSRGHYSIDIIGAVMMSYILVIQGRKFYDTHFKPA